MRRIIGLALLIGTFLGGYHLGRQKNSPDVIGYAHHAIMTVAAVVEDIANSFSDKDSAGNSSPAQADSPVADSSGRDTSYDTRTEVSRPYVPQDRSAPGERQTARGTQSDQAAQSSQTVARAEETRDSQWASRIWRALNEPAQK